VWVTRPSRGGQERFAQLGRGLAPLLAASGFASPPPLVVPVSALHDHNLRASHPPPPEGAWYAGPTLLEAIDRLPPSPRPATCGARLCVNDAFASAGLGALALSGTLQALND
jgi:translation elongation factor EF-1alpha